MNIIKTSFLIIFSLCIMPIFAGFRIGGVGGVNLGGSLSYGGVGGVSLSGGSGSRKKNKLKMFIRDIEGLKFQIIQNWCLCKWCQLFDPANENFNHWKEELASHLLQLQNSKLKCKISKKKQLKRYFIEYYEYNDKVVVVGAIRDKFYRENIIDKLQIDAVADEFSKNINSIIDVISDPSKPIMLYLNEMFG